MAFFVDHGQHKHFCKICKRGFMCGRALGGHMRAHGIGEAIDVVEDEDTNNYWEDRFEANDNDNDDNNDNNKVSYENTRMYALRENPSRLKSYSSCKHCGKEFSSWKCYFEHGRCGGLDDDESLVSSHGSDGGEDEYNDVEAPKIGWSKRKRSVIVKIDDHCNDNSFYRPSNEEEDLANCLMMLSNATFERSMVATELEESCASASKDEEFHRQNLMNFVTSTHAIVDIKAKNVPTTSHNNNNNNNNKTSIFECKACKKVFNSHQALGGHRASHKKVKGCFASCLDHLNDNGTNATSSSTKRKPKVHECSICHRIFSSGQALGGHKRCHWLTSNSTDPSSLIKQFQQFQQYHIEQVQEHPLNLNLNLDLNLPAPPRDKFRVPAEIYLQTWLRANEEGKKDKIHVTNNNSNSYVDDEADSKVKLAKLSDLKDMNINEKSSSPWLQVGIGSSVGPDP